MAEVLITLGIIGIVAAMTIPNLISNYQNRTHLVALKKMYANLQNAQTMINIEFGEPISWQLATNSNENNNLNTKIANYYAETLGGVIKFCGHTSIFPLKSGCVAGKNEEYLTLNNKIAQQNCWYTGNGIYHYTYQYLFKDGSTLAILFQTNAAGGHYGPLITRKIIALFILDVNGNAKPNQIGKDIFYLMLKDNRLIPLSFSSSDKENDCNKDGLGYTCAYEIINNGWNFPENYPR